MLAVERYPAEGEGEGTRRRLVMRHEFFQPGPDRRFQKRAVSTIVGTLRKADQMSPDSATNADEPINPTEAAIPLRAADYLWRPRYAKLWWVAILIYWMPAGGPTRIAWLADFYEGGYAVIPNLIFLPITALLVLGFGYFRRLFAEGTPAEPRFDIGYGSRRHPGRPHPTMDEFDPRSGPRWIGNRPYD
jgi:hypothetical protein